MRNTAPAWIALTAAMVGLCARAQAAPGDIDHSFAIAGRLTHTGTIVPMRDGRLAIAATTTGVAELLMYRPDGRPDTTFGEAGTARYPSAAAAGFTALAGAASTDHSVFLLGRRAAVLKLNAAGTVATDFGNAGSGLSTIDSAAGSAALTIDAQGRPLAVITQPCPDPSCPGPLRLVRLRTDGSVDTSFGTAGRTELVGIEGANLQPALLAARSGGGAMVVDFYGRALAVNSAGQPDPQFGNAGLLQPTAGFPAYLVRASSLPRDRLLLAGPIVQNDLTQARLTMLAATGERDIAFAGDGTLDLAELGIAAIAGAAPGQPFELMDVATATDGNSIYVLIGFGLRDTEPFRCVGVLALNMAGAVRIDFGERGFSCIGKDFPYYASLSTEANGALLYNRVDDATEESIVERVSTGVAGGRGLIGFRLRRAAIDENNGRIEVAVSRLAGRDGTATIGYQIVGQSAAADSDFIAETGTLTWPAGDSSDRSITVRLVDDSLPESSETVSLRLLQGSATTTGGEFVLTILDSDRAPTPTPSPPGVPSSSSGGGGGGGGGIDAAMLGLMLAALGARAAALRPRRAFPRTTRCPRAQRPCLALPKLNDIAVISDDTNGHQQTP